VGRGLLRRHDSVHRHRRAARWPRLILPAATGIAPILTPIAATGLAVIMVLAAATHIRRKEPSGVAVNAVLFLLAAAVAWGRFGPYG
jgi:hypothetical protein